MKKISFLMLCFLWMGLTLNAKVQHKQLPQKLTKKQCTAELQRITATANQVKEISQQLLTALKNIASSMLALKKEITTGTCGCSSPGRAECASCRAFYGALNSAAQAENAAWSLLATSIGTPKPLPIQKKKIGNITFSIQPGWGTKSLAGTVTSFNKLMQNLNAQTKQFAKQCNFPPAQIAGIAQTATAVNATQQRLQVEQEIGNILNIAFLGSMLGKDVIFPGVKALVSKVKAYYARSLSESAAEKLTPAEETALEEEVIEEGLIEVKSPTLQPTITEPLPGETGDIGAGGETDVDPFADWDIGDLTEDMVDTGAEAGEEAGETAGGAGEAAGEATAETAVNVADDIMALIPK